MPFYFDSASAAGFCKNIRYFEGIGIPLSKGINLLPRALFGKSAYVFAGRHTVKLFERAGEIRCGIIPDHVADDGNVGFPFAHELYGVVHAFYDEKFGKCGFCLLFKYSQKIIGVKAQILRHVFCVHITVRNVGLDIVESLVDIIVDIVGFRRILIAINDCKP